MHAVKNKEHSLLQYSLAKAFINPRQLCPNAYLCAMQPPRRPLPLPQPINFYHLFASNQNFLLNQLDYYWANKNAASFSQTHLHRPKKYSTENLGIVEI